ncbi:hypothetical protein [Rhodovulum euryhalinum]|uniref:Uncharacterized protein n=1 Tax=Rhodovulum euryhalinum TaxID=35805 RepID=A0A4R2KF79_9RHOB|nr:hypothetical protein [Rhodovulum euryhalinum]TCO70982.1 hypothetical protein EV655_108228 [Rhodovulum euryhalinum]
MVFPPPGIDCGPADAAVWWEWPGDFLGQVNERHPVDPGADDWLVSGADFVSEGSELRLGANQGETQGSAPDLTPIPPEWRLAYFRRRPFGTGSGRTRFSISS